MAIYIGIDGDGTLYNTDGTIDSGNLNSLISTLEKSRENGMILCHTTGKDIPYVNRMRRIYPEVFNALDFNLLENGAVAYNEEKIELLTVRNRRLKLVDTDNELLKNLDELVCRLSEKELQGEIKKRLASVQYRTENRNSDSNEDFGKIKEWLEQDIHPGEFYATMSAYAIFVNQAGISKWTALKYVAGDSTTCAIGDSLNDFESLRNSHYGFVPENAAEKLLEELEKDGFKIVNLDSLDAFYAGSNSADKKTKRKTENSAEKRIYISGKECSAAVIEVLEKIMLLKERR